MTSETLREIGRLLHGPHWQAALAEDLKVNDRTVRRWAQDQWPVPDGIQADLKALIEQRVLDLQAMIRALD